MKVSGLDLSMTKTGVAHTVEGAACTHLIKPKEVGDLRLPEIASRVIEYVRDSDFVIIEGYLNHSHTAGITGMVHGAVRAALIEEGLKYATLPPTSLKKFASGRGGASKTDMAVAAFKRGGEIEFTDDNQCDAWWLWVAATHHLGIPAFPLPKAQTDALDALKMEA